MEEGCINCKLVKPNLMRCGRCHHVAYCSVACQKEHWKKIHKSQCVPIVEGVDEKKARLDLSRRWLSTITNQEPLMIAIGAFMYHKSPNGHGTFICKVISQGLGVKCVLVYKPVEVIGFTTIPDMFNLRFILEMNGTSVGYVSGLKIDYCREDYESAKDLINFNNYSEGIIFFIDAQNICTIHNDNGSTIKLI